MSKRRKKRRIRLIVTFIGLVLVFSLILSILVKIINKDDDIKKEMPNYGYKLRKNDPKIKEDLFNKLASLLSNNEIEYDLYAEYISELFIIDLYNIESKTNKYDITSADYVYPSAVENFKVNVKDTIYRYLEDKTIRNSKLPEVKEIELVSIKEKKYNYNSISYDGYEVSLKWSYREDLGYDKEGKVGIIKENNKLYIANYTPEV